MELRPYQQDCIATIEAQPPGSYLVQMATGLGKCFAPGTEILMFDGTIRRVEDIREGEQVMGADSTPRTVVGLAHGEEPMYRITPTKGEPYIVNESHILSLKITGLNGKNVTDSLGRKFSGHDICNISVQDYLKSSKTFKHCAKGWRVAVDYPERPVTIPPYILGIWLGDGASRGTSVTTMEPEIVHEMQRYAAKNKMRVCVCDSSNTGRATTYSFIGKGREHGCNTFRNELKSMGLFQNKHIPSDYLLNDRKNRMELLAGLLDTDGFLVDETVFEITTCQKILEKNILTLARSLGFAAYSAPKAVNGETYYRIDISGDTSEIPTRVPRRQANPRSQKKNVLVTGIKVEPVGLGEYYGFELQGKDRLFLLADFTVVHNTVTFANLPRHGERMLILSHREELVEQPRKYFDCTYGVERAGSHADGEEVVSASVQSLVRRLERFSPHDFGLIICDEAHHAAANTYRKIFEYFQPLKLVGFTATPNRGDKIRLSDVFQKIIFQRDLRWGIQNKYLCDILCKRVDIGYDLRAVHTRNGDYAPGELDEAMEGTADAIAQTYREHAAGATLIFAVSVHQAEEIAGRIKGAVVVTGETKDRAAIIEAFTAGEIPCIVNCMVFTEGTDIPRVETVIVARPTQSESLYAQMVGRGLRLYPSKERLVLIDCVGITGKASLCTAPSLLGLDLSNIPARKATEIQGDLFDLPLKIAAAGDCPESWIRNVEIVDLWAQEQKYNTHDINFFKMPDGEMVVSLTDGKSLTIPCPNSLGLVHMPDGSQVGMQEAIDRVYMELLRDYTDCRQLWDLESVRRWGKAPATDKQVAIIQRRCKGFDTAGLSKGDASQILNRLFNAPKKKGRQSA